MSSAFVIAGPTAAGKTALALDIASAFDAVVLSADAMQVYRGMDIGTAKATLEERATVPHFGIDVVEPDQPFDAADFMALGDSLLEAGKRVVVAGGTALYIQAFRRGLVHTPPVDPEFRASLTGDLHAQLAVVDPELAERLHPNDHVRIVRGLEVYAASGQRLSELQRQHKMQPDRHTVRGVWLDRDDLDTRIDGRVHTMMEAGYLQEVESLLARFSRTIKPMKSLGYRHLADHLLDGLPIDEAVRRTQRDSRKFARKQRTWRKQLPVEDADPWKLAQEVFGAL